MTVTSRWKCANRLEKRIQKETETKQNYEKKPNRILKTWKRDKREECDDDGNNASTNGKYNKELNAAATPVTSQRLDVILLPYNWQTYNNTSSENKLSAG